MLNIKRLIPNDPNHKGTTLLPTLLQLIVSIWSLLLKKLTFAGVPRCGGLEGSSAQRCEERTECIIDPWFCRLFGTWETKVWTRTCRMWVISRYRMNNPIQNRNQEENVNMQANVVVPNVNLNMQYAYNGNQNVSEVTTAFCHYISIYAPFITCRIRFSRRRFCPRTRWRICLYFSNNSNHSR